MERTRTGAVAIGLGPGGRHVNEEAGILVPSYLATPGLRVYPAEAPDSMEQTQAIPTKHFPIPDPRFL